MQFYLYEKIVIAIAGFVVVITFLGITPFEYLEIAKKDPVIAIAGCALLLTIWQGWETRKNNRLSLEPLLKFEGSHLETDDPVCEGRKGFFHYKFILSNYGVGPALMKKFVLLSDSGKTSYNTYEEFYDFLYETMKGLPYHNLHYLSDSGVVKSGEKQTLWELIYDSSDPVQCKKFNKVRKLWMDVEYQSIYKEKTIPLDFRGELLLQSEGHPIPANLRPKVKKMAEIYAACFIHSHPWTAEYFADLLNKPTMEIVTQYLDENDVSSLCSFIVAEWLDKEQIELIAVAVIPHEQGKGLGRELLNNFIAGIKAKDGKSIFLEVAANNAPALHLYKELGFKRVGMRPAYYEMPNTPNIDAITMRLDIET